jgi:hypothetical protein
LKIRSLIVFFLILSVSLSTTMVPYVLGAEDSWTTLEPMPTARNGLGVAVVDGKIYAIGGAYFGHNEMYDPATDTWTIKNPMPTPRAYFGIAVYQNKIYCIGGQTGFLEFTGVNEVYDPATDTWETKASMSNPRGWLCANVVKDKIYLIAGTFRATPYSTAVTGANEIYDPETDSWTTRAYMPNFEGLGSIWLTSAVVDNKIYIMSATSHAMSGTPKDPFSKIYDSETDTWSSGTMVSMPRFQLAAGATSGEFAPKRIHILSGDTHPIYDPETDTWTTGTPMPTLRWLFGITVINDELYAIGGYNGTTIFAVNEKYTPISYIPEFPQWTPLLITLDAVIAVAVIYRRSLRKQVQRRNEQ